MIRIYHAPRTRSLRVIWLLEELELPYEVVNVEFQPPSSRFFVQQTPLGKLPTLEDGEVLMCESGAMIEYVLEFYAQGRLLPPSGSVQRAAYYQWLHFAESTAFPPLGIMVWLTRYRDDASEHAGLLEDTRSRAASGFGFVEAQIGDKQWLLGEEFTAADIMMGFTLLVARGLGVLDARFPLLDAYLRRLEARPAFARAMLHQ